MELRLETARRSIEIETIDREGAYMTFLVDREAGCEVKWGTHKPMHHHPWRRLVIAIGRRAVLITLTGYNAAWNSDEAQAYRAAELKEERRRREAWFDSVPEPA